MDDSNKSREQLLEEIAYLRHRLAQLESSGKVASDSKRIHSAIDRFPIDDWSAEEQLLLSRFSVEVAADEVFWIREDAKVFYVNDSACRRLGYSRDEMLRMHVWDWDPNLKREKWPSFWGEMQKCRKKTFETWHRTKDDEILPVEISASIFSHGGKDYLFAFVKDITESKELEHRLLSKNAQFEAIFNSITDVVVFVDTARFFAMVNPAFTDIFGYSAEEVAGQQTQILYADPDVYSCMGKLRDKVSANGGSHLFQVEYRRKDGSTFMGETLGVIVKDLQGEHIGYLGIIRDISERLAAEKTLWEHRAKFDAALDSMSEGLYIVDSSGGIVDFNEAWARFCRFDTKEEYLQSPIDPPAVFQLFRTNGELLPMEEWPTSCALRGERGNNAEYIIHRSDSNQSWAGSYSYSPIRDDDAEIAGAVVVARDITEFKQKEKAQRQLEDRLRQAQKMEAIGTLAGGIAHDFNNILSVIMGYTDMARHEIEPELPLAKRLEQVLAAAGRARDLVAQILAFSRQSQVELMPIKIQPVLKEALKMLRSSIPSTISIVQKIDAQSGAVLADPTQIHQIAMNLCANAFHAMESTGGTLSVSLKTTRISQSDIDKFLPVNPGEYVQLSVADTGVGMEPDVLERIFDPYFTTKEAGKGTGMGLSIVHGIIKEYGGAITVESKPDQGTTFHIYLPVLQLDAASEEQAGLELPRGTERVLVVDDEKALAEMAKAMLEGLGYAVTVKYSSVEALAFFMNDPDAFDIVLTDQTMPRLVGSDLAKKMIEIKPDIRIILCTGYSSLIDEESAKAAGIREFVLKPFSIQTISTVVRRVMDEP